MKAATVCLLAALATRSFAHQLDEYIQATTFSIEKNRLSATMRLIPGERVYRQVLRLIDHDHNGSISPREQHIYGRRILRDLYVAIDGKRRPLKLGGKSFPALALMKEGVGEIRLTFSAPLQLSPGDHRLLFINRHVPRIAAYLVNCTVPADPALKVVSQKRSRDQSRYEVRFQLDRKLIDSITCFTVC